MTYSPSNQHLISNSQESYPKSYSWMLYLSIPWGKKRCPIYYRFRHRLCLHRSLYQRQICSLVLHSAPTTNRVAPKTIQIGSQNHKDWVFRQSCSQDPSNLLPRTMKVVQGTEICHQGHQTCSVTIKVAKYKKKKNQSCSQDHQSRSQDYYRCS